ncbi:MULTISPECIES: helix-turn-helix domain-containing protein [unclassified Variovorax]|uniref:helix-turn-helix domain-containing protein n=1 Tax=unclassified Variovorax TaxID=663243 RepID=UPI001BD65D7A|nr:MULTISPECIES: helix-turn-helix domain-containing protein [unclassified Variovorax]
MIERASQFGAPVAVPLAGGDSALLSAGAMLRQAREAHGLDIAVVAAALKVPVQKLEALEDDNIGALPDPVFARALAASVCRALKIDPAPVLAKIPGAKRPGLADADRTMSSNIRSGAPHQGRTGGVSMPSRALMVVVGLLLLGAALMFWIPQSAFDKLSGAVSKMTGQSETAAVEAPPAPPGTVVEPVAPNGPAAEPTPPVPAVVAPVPPPTPAPPSDVLVFTARGDSWVTVTDSGGKELLRRTVKTGETVGVSGTLPLKVIVGRASQVDVQVRGKPFDTTPLAKAGGVARFEVKP